MDSQVTPPAAVPPADEPAAALPPPLPSTLAPPMAVTASPAPVLPPPIPYIVPPKPFPGLGQALAVLALMLVCQAVLAAVLWIADQSLGTKSLENAAMLGAVNLVTFTLVCWVVGRRMGVPLAAVLGEAPPAGTFSAINVLAVCGAVAGQLLFAVGCVYALGGKAIEKSDYMKRLNEILGPGQSWWVVVLLLVVVAPLTEETLFRGQFLRGFLARYAPPLAIGLSAGLFSLIHMNPLQVPATLLLGILSGVLYERTRSVWPSIFAHMVNNSVPALAVATAAAVKGAKTAKADLEPTIGAMLGLMVGGMAIWLLALATLRQNVPARQAIPPRAAELNREPSAPLPDTAAPAQ